MPHEWAHIWHGLPIFPIAWKLRAIGVLEVSKISWSQNVGWQAELAFTTSSYLCTCAGHLDAKLIPKEDHISQHACHYAWACLPSIAILIWM